MIETALAPHDFSRRVEKEGRRRIRERRNKEGRGRRIEKGQGSRVMEGPCESIWVEQIGCKSTTGEQDCTHKRPGSYVCVCRARMPRMPSFRRARWASLTRWPLCNHSYTASLLQARGYTVAVRPSTCLPLRICTQCMPITYLPCLYCNNSYIYVQPTIHKSYR